MKTKSAYRLVRTGSRAAYLLAGSIAALLAAGTAPLARAATWNVGSANWNTVDSNWNVSPWSNGSDATFGGTAGSTITINELAISANSLTFNVTGDTIAGSASNDLTLTSGSITVDEALNATISAPINGTSGLIKKGAGILVLAGNNIYSGTTVIGGGTLQLGVGGVLPAASAMRLDYGVSTGFCTLDLNGHDATVASLYFNGNAGVGWGMVTTGVGTLTVTGDITSELYNLYSSPTSYTQGGTGGAVTAISGKLALSGGVTHNLIAQGQYWWTPIAAAISGGAIDGLSIASGQWSFLGANTYSGGTTLNNSANLAVGDDAALGAGALIFNTNGQGGLSSVDATAHIIGNALTFTGDASFGAAGTGKLTFTAAADLGGTRRTLSVNNSAVQFDGILSNGGIDKAGQGMLILTHSANAFTTDMRISAGTMRLDADNALSGNLMLYGDSGAETLLDLNGYNVTIGSLYMGGQNWADASRITTGAGKLTLGGNVTYDQGNGNLGSTIEGKLSLGSANRIFNVGHYMAVNDLSVSAIISGDTGVGLEKNGGGTLVLSGQNTYTGATTINNGMVQLRAPQMVPPFGTSGPLGVGGSIVFNNGDENSFQGALQYSSDNNYDYSSRFTGGGFYKVDSNGQNVIWATGLANNFMKLGSGTLTLSSPMTGGSYKNMVRQGTVTTGAANVLAGRGGLVIAGYTAGANATLDLANHDDSISGVLALGGAAGSSALITTGTGMLTLGKGDINGTGDVTLWYDNGYNDLGATISGKLDLHSGNNLIVVRDSANAQYDVAISANISGTGTLNLSRGQSSSEGVGVLLLAGTNSYSGGTTISNGTLVAAKPASLPDYDVPGKVTVASGATLAVPYGGGSDWISADITTLLSNNGAGFASASSLGLDTTNAASGASFDPSPLAGRSLGLNKLGTHTLTLTGASTHTGGTTISAGTLSISADNNLGTGGLTLANGATLLTTASFSSNRNVTLNSGGGVFAQAPGTTLTLSGAIGGSGTLMQSGPGTLAVHGGNNSLTVPIQINGGTLDLGSFNQTVSSVAGTGTISGSGTLTLKVSAQQTFAGALGGSINLAKEGSAELIVTQANPTTGSLSVLGGTLTLEDAGTFANASAINIRNSTLYLNNSGTQEISGRVGSTQVNLDNGSIYYLGAASTGSTSTESIGPVVLRSGLSTITVANFSGGGAEVTLASLTRDTGALATIGNWLGQTGNNPRLLVTAGVSGTLAPVGGVVPGVFSNSNFTNLVGYDSLLGFGTLGTPGFAWLNEYNSGDLSDAPANANVTGLSARVVKAGGQTINSLNCLGASITFANATDKLTLASGMLAGGGDSIGVNVGTTDMRGQLTSGLGSGELFYLKGGGGSGNGNFGESNINSVIVDNGNPLSGGTRVSLVVMAPDDPDQPGMNPGVSAANTYTGGTFVSALPPRYGGSYGGYFFLNATTAGVVTVPAAFNPLNGLVINRYGNVMELNSGGQIAASNIVTFNGGGSLSLVGDNTLAGFVFNGGRVDSGGSGILKITGDITSTPTSLQAARTVSSFSWEEAQPGTFLSGTPLDLNAASAHSITVAALPSNPAAIGLSILSTIQNGGFTKKGAGVLEVTANNTFDGQLSVEEGQLFLATINNASSNGPLGNSALPVILGGSGGKTGTIRYTGSDWGWNNSNSDKPFTLATGGSGGFQVDSRPWDNVPLVLTLSGVIDGGGGLTKTGTGTLALTNTNTYTGDTTIEDGVLSLGTQYLDDDSTLTIGTAAGSSAVLNLPNAGTDFVAALVIDGETMPNGTYDSTNSGGAITGAGIIQVGVSTPQIVVEENSITLSSGGTVDYGSQAVSSQTDFVFTISNSGDMPLTLNGTPMVAVSGTNAANFTVITPPTSPVAGKGSTTFTLRFIPSAVGARAATLTIASDSTTDGSFTLNLTGTGTADYSEWVKAYTGDMSTGGDPDGDGVKNQQEYAFGLNPNSGTSANPIIVPFHKTTGTFSYTRRDPSLTGLSYKILTSTTLQAASWTEDTGAVQTPGPVSGGTQTVAVQLSPSLLSAPKLFMRVEAVQP